MADIASKCKITCNVYDENDQPVYEEKDDTQDNSEYYQMNHCINTVLIDYDYLNKIMPIIYIRLTPTLNLWDKIIKNSEKGTFYLKIQTFDPRTDTPIYKTIIEEKFMYFVPTSYNYTTEKTEEIERDQQTKNMTLGLIKLDLVNKNKTSFNGVYLNTNNKELVKFFTKDLGKTYIDKIQNNEKYNTFLLTPQPTVKDALATLFEKSPFYNEEYYFFMDYNKSYIIAKNGAAKDETKTKVLIKVNDVSGNKVDPDELGEEGYKTLPGTGYLMNVNVTNANLQLNTTTQKTTNQLVGIDTDEITSADLTVSKEKPTNKSKMIITRSNATLTQVKKSLLDNTAAFLTVSKLNVDPMFITPDKCYEVQNIDQYQEFNGKFLLIYKKVILSRNDHYFASTINFSLQRLTNGGEELEDDE